MKATNLKMRDFWILQFEKYTNIIKRELLK